MHYVPTELRVANSVVWRYLIKQHSVPSR